MRRLIFLTVPILVLIVLATGVIAIEARRPAEWQTKLNEYLHDRNLRSPGGIRVQSAARASKAWNLCADMSHAVFGNQAWSHLELPFPPEELWCVLLKQERTSSLEPSGGTAYQVVFVSYHTDRLWNEGWVVQAGVGNPFAPAFIEGLSTIGCDLGLKEMEPGDIQPIVMIGGE